MTTLCYSSFMNLLFEYSVSAEKETIAEGVLSSFVSEEVSENFDSSYFSKILTGSRDLVGKIRDDIAKPKNRKACVDYFESDIIPCIRPEQMDDFKEKLVNLINFDETISESKKKKLLEANALGDNVEFFSSVFIYAINKPNKKPIESLTIEDLELYEEVDQYCPLCNQPLFFQNKAKTKTIYRYSIIKIFPDNLSKVNYDDFNELHPAPLEFGDNKNRICLCDACAESYVFTPTSEVYDKLYNFKGRALKSTGFKRTTGSAQLDSEISKILGNIKDSDIEADSFKKLRMIPLKVINKIKPSNRLLIKDINDDNDAYYNYIKEVLSKQEEHKKSFKKIALEIQKCFLDLTDRTDDQDEIYNALIQWILDSQRLPESYRTAAHIVISFFVQNCEVFDEITE